MLPIELAELRRVVGEAVGEMFGTTLRMDVRVVASRRPLSLAPWSASCAADDLVASIPLTGGPDAPLSPDATLCVAASRASARAAVEAMLGDDAADDLLADCLGELTNMIAGGIKRRLTHTPYNVVLGIPQVTPAGLPTRCIAGERVLDLTYRFADDCGLRVVYDVGS